MTMRVTTNTCARILNLSNQGEFHDLMGRICNFLSTRALPVNWDNNGVDLGISCTGEAFEVRVMDHESPRTVYSTRKSLVMRLLALF